MLGTKLSKIPHILRNVFRKYSVKTAKSESVSTTTCKLFGQPTYESHPHLLNQGEITPLISKEEFQNRREKLVESVLKYAKKNCAEKKHVIIIPAASKQYMSDKIPYVFRQNTDFLYFTGCQEPDCCVVLTIDSNDSYCTTLFTRNKDEHAELWDGPRTHPECAVELFGVDQSLPISELENFLVSYKTTNRHSRLWYDLMASKTSTHEVICSLMQIVGNKSWESPKALFHKIRLYKSKAEIALMQKACDITAEAFADTISCSKPGVSESILFAKIDYECRLRGAEFLAYPPVIAGGDRATIIHYINNNQLVLDNEMVLMDAGCEYHGYASDVTRTWPINGKFTPQQREIYEIVYSVQQELIEFCNKFPSLDSLFESMCFLLGKRLQEIGLIGMQPSQTYLMKAAYQLCPHHVSHYLGMDIHDTSSINRNIPIEPGMVITIEPGIYVDAKNTSLPKEYRGIGIRLEDDILITVNGPVVLSRKCPKHINEIEEIASQHQ